jgi:hypothetical protein
MHKRILPVLGYFLKINLTSAILLKINKTNIYVVGIYNLKKKKLENGEKDHI